MHFRETGFVNTARVTAMTIISLVFRLIAGDAQLVDIDHNNKIAGIHMRSENGLMFAAQTMGDLCRETPSTLSAASITNQSWITSCGLAEKVFTKPTPAISVKPAHSMPETCQCQP